MCLSCKGGRRAAAPADGMMYTTAAGGPAIPGGPAYDLLGLRGDIGVNKDTLILALLCFLAGLYLNKKF